MRILIVAPCEGSGPRFGPNIRMEAFARELAPVHHVTLAYPGPTLPAATAAYETIRWSRGSVSRELKRHDIIISHGLQYPARHTIRQHPIQVFDLYDPVILEQLASPEPDGRNMAHLSRLTRLLLQTGDYFLCASPEQRDLWIGGIYAAGRVNDIGSAPAEHLIGIVPFGHDGSEPTSARRVLKGGVPGISEHDRVLLWGGGIWNWFDPETLIRAMAEIAKDRADVKLFFLSGGGQPSTPATLKLEQSRALAHELNVYGTSVIFNEGGVDFDDRVNYLMESDLAVCTAPDTLENHFSFRTRLVDAVWASLPIICTRGGWFAGFVEHNQLGFTVEPGSVSDLKEKLLLALNPDLQNKFRQNFARCRNELAWNVTTRPLKKFCQRIAAGEKPLPKSVGWTDYLLYKAPALLR